MILVESAYSINELYQNESYQRKKIIIILLIIASLVIWSRNIYMLFTDTEADDSEMNTDSVLLQNNTDISIGSGRNDYSYPSIYRDPFKPWFVTLESRTQNQNIKQSASIIKSAPIPPHLRYCGVIRDIRGPLAILENTNGEMVYISRGDTINQIRIIDISEDSLHCQWESMFYKIPLQH